MRHMKHRRRRESAGIAVAVLAGLLAAVLIGGIGFLRSEFSLNEDHYIGLLNIVVVGVLVALVSVLIPSVYSQARDRFDRYKEARLAYSKAKTAVLYLGDRIVEAASHREQNERAQLFALVEKAHRELHLAETFGEDIRAQRFLSWYDDPSVWILHNYWRIVAVSAALRWYEENAPFADEPEPAVKLRDKIKKTSTLVDNAFGELGGKWDKYEEGRAKEAAKRAKCDYESENSGMYLNKTERDRRMDRARRLAREDRLATRLEILTVPGGTIGIRERYSSELSNEKQYS